MSGILRLESLTKGNTLRQGDLTLLKYRLFDADGDKLDISGKPATVRLMKNDFTFIAYEKEGFTIAPDDTISFSVNKILPSGLYHLEVIVDNQYIFPSRDDEGKVNIDKSSLGADVTIVEVTGVEAVARKATGMMKQDEEFIDDLIENVISDTNVGNIEEYYNQFNEATAEFESFKTQALNSVTKSDKAIVDSASAKSIAQGIDAKATNALSLSNSADALSKSVQEQFNQVVIDGDSSVESAQARVDANGQTNPTLKARLDKEYNEVTAQLAQTPNYLQNISNINSVKMIAHRGFSEGAPENTIPAIEQAGKLGYWGVEFDVVVTSDDEWVAIHDDTVDRTTDGVGLVKGYTLSEIQALRITGGNNVALYPNLKIPTLHEMLRACKKYNLVPFIEIKERDYTTENYMYFLNILQRWGYEEKAIVNAFRHEPINALRNLSDKLTFAVIGNITDFNINYVRSVGNALLSAPLSDINTANVVKCYEAGVTLSVWTVNNANELYRVSNLGVNYVITDKLLGSNGVNN